MRSFGSESNGQREQGLPSYSCARGIIVDQNHMHVLEMHAFPRMARNMMARRS